MRIILNERPTVFDAEQMSIEDIMMLKSFTSKLMKVTLNGLHIKKECYPTIMVHDGDTLQIKRLV